MFVVLSNFISSDFRVLPILLIFQMFLRTYKVFTVSKKYKKIMESWFLFSKTIFKSSLPELLSVDITLPLYDSRVLVSPNCSTPSGGQVLEKYSIDFFIKFNTQSKSRNSLRLSTSIIGKFHVYQGDLIR